MNNKMSENNERFQDLSMSHPNSQEQESYDQEHQNIKKVLDMIDNQPSQQIQIHNNMIDGKMAAFKSLQSEGLCNEIDQHQQSYPFSRNQSFSRQNLSRMEHPDYSNHLQSKFFQQDHHQSFDLHLKDSVFDKQESLSQQISGRKSKILIQMNSQIEGSIQGQFMFPSEISQNKLMHQHSNLLIKDASIEEMAPNFINNKLYKDTLTPKFYNAPLSFPNSFPFTQQQAHYNEQCTKIQINTNFEGEEQFLTPVKLQSQTPQYGKTFALTEAKQKSSAQKASISNLQQIRNNILPVHIINEKSKKPKILDYVNGKPKKSQHSGKMSNLKVSLISASSSSHLDKKNSKDTHGVESNRRMNKIKNKKRNINKTEPTLQQQSSFVNDQLASYRSTLTVQTYQITHLNSLEELNKKLREQKREYVSLSGNFELNIQDSFKDQVKQAKDRHHESKNISSIQEDEKSSKNNKEKKTHQIQNYQITNLTRNKSQWFPQTTPQKMVTFQEQRSESALKIKTQPMQQPFFSIQEKGATFLSSQQTHPERKVKCNCQKNHCAQAYCDCLKSGNACDPKICHCQDCENKESNTLLRAEIILKQHKQGSSKEGCNCKNSQCLKRYCECYQEGRICDPTKCRCQDCRNNDVKIMKTTKMVGMNVRHTQ